MDGERAIDRLIDGELPARPWDQQIAELARLQHGVVGRKELLALGMGRGAIEVRVERGTLHEVHRGVYVVGVRRISRRGRWMAAVIAGGPGAVLSHGSAGLLWGLVPPGASLAEITCADGGRARRPGIRAHRGAVAEDERTTVDGIPSTSPFRTILDLAGELKGRQLERAWNEMQVRRLTDRLSLDELLTRHRGRRGIAVLRELVRSTQPEGITRNELEERFVGFLDAHGLPRPRLNAPLRVRGRFIEVDCLWEQERLAVELDGYQVHGTPRAFQGDRKRDRELLAEGWRSIRVTWRQLGDEPEAVAEDLRQALETPSRHPHQHGK